MKEGSLFDMNEHHLKCWPEFFESIKAGVKTFEIRKNDRGFKVDDLLILEEWDPSEEDYTGRKLYAAVTYITAWAQRECVVVMGIKLLPGGRTHEPD